MNRIQHRLLNNRILWILRNNLRKRNPQTTRNIRNVRIWYWLRFRSYIWLRRWLRRWSRCWSRCWCWCWFRSWRWRRCINSINRHVTFYWSLSSKYFAFILTCRISIPLYKSITFFRWCRWHHLTCNTIFTYAFVFLNLHRSIIFIAIIHKSDFVDLSFRNNVVGKVRNTNYPKLFVDNIVKQALTFKLARFYCYIFAFFILLKIR
ncbi:Uncharacterised protein [Chlamydia trachomatis]|nr:Uncharacterised protein [Chlamydia trachomatis]